METLLQQQDRSLGEGNPNIIKVLAYHRIVDDSRLSEAHWSCVHIKRFRKHLELLDRWGFTTITFNDYLLYRQGQLNLPAKPVIITFDDGYADTHRFAFPLLQEFGMKAAVFVLGDRKIKTNYWERTVGIPEVPLMDGQQIVELHEAGFEIGAHSMTHAKLTEISQGDAWQEISRSRILLEILLNDPVTVFSYPYGLVNRTLKSMVQDAGYALACGVYTGPAVFGSDVHEIRRITIKSSAGTAAFAARMLTPFQHYAWLRWKIAHALKNGKHSDREIRRILAEKRKREAKRSPLFEAVEEHGSEK